MKRLVFVAMFAACLAMAPRAEAALITGGLSFGGFAAPTGPGSNWLTATGIAFANPAIAGSGVGSYASITSVAVTFTNFTYSPFGASVVPLWTFTTGGSTYSFDLTSVAGVIAQGNASVNGIQLIGGGMLYITGYTPTPGVFIITTNQASGPTGLSTFSFSASNAAVPEPTSMLLLGTGLLGLAAVARRRMKKA